MTKLTSVNSMEVLTDGTVALAGSNQNRMLVQYNISSGQLLFSKEIELRSGNLTLVKLGRQQCVVINRQILEQDCLSILNITVPHNYVQGQSLRN